ncbi:hypothetical protein DH2020_014937 [Rehmannia glutinosa]|uniref:Transposase MuDR plant domain-containing protein n=1 Tax=Rehmannia glutinosa TaxID=99300 RepID=A0ABR0WXY6_REHGL
MADMSGENEQIFEGGDFGGDLDGGEGGQCDDSEEENYGNDSGDNTGNASGDDNESDSDNNDDNVDNWFDDGFTNEKLGKTSNKEFRVPDDPTEQPKLEKGMRFSDVYDFRKALREYEVRTGFELKLIKNDKQRVTAGCGAT